MKDNTASICHALARYEGLEFIPLRAQDAFDPDWWGKTNQGLDFSHIGVDLTSEGILNPT